MNILLLNTSDTTGGAAQACNRLYRALQHAGADVSFFVNEKTGNSTDIHSFNETFFKKKSLMHVLQPSGFCSIRNCKTKKTFSFSRLQIQA